MKTLPKEIEAKLPSPLWDAYNVFIQENDSQPFRKVHRLIDLIEVFCKLYTVGSMATFLNALRYRMGNLKPLNEESYTKIKVMLATGLKSPSLGIWWSFARDITSILQNINITHILPGAETELLNKKSSIKLAFDGEKNLITFRNSYAHGATPTDEICKKDIEETWPRVLQILSDATSLREVKLVICTDEKSFFCTQGEKIELFEGNLDHLQGHSWFCYDNQSVNLYPILSFKFHAGNADFFFYNDLKDKHANYLNYPNAEHVKDVNLRNELLQIIPIEDWKKINNIDLEPFRHQVEMLTEVFKGRKEELNSIAQFLNDEENRFLCIWGPPGVGKSALLARTTQILRCSPEIREAIVGDDAWPQFKVYLTEYFIRSGSTNTASQFFDSINQRLDFIFHLRVEFGKSDSEKQAFFQIRLHQIAKLLKHDERLLLIIDGLDEIKNGDPLLNLLPKLIPEKIQVIYGARPQQELRFTFYEQLDRERRKYFNLGGISLEDIRAILMEHVSKYEMEHSYVEEVLRVSEGNPLYLKLLCSGLEQKIYKLNQSSTLPKRMDELYQTALLRMEKENPGSLNFLLYIAAAKDFVSPELTSDWIGESTTQLRNKFLYACIEFLYENTLTTTTEDYQLFHESLREYLSKTYAAELQQCKERICDWTINWKSTNGDINFENDLLTYAMQFSTEHLFESYLYHKNSNRIATQENRKNQLFTLVKDEKWRALNFETCGNGEALGRSYYFLQKILAKEDNKGNLFEDFFSYAYNRYAEPQKMFLSQRDILMKPVKLNQLTAHFERIPSLSKMGERFEDKVMLAILPIWANDVRDGIPKQFEEKISSWLENTRSSAVKKLWAKTQK